MKEAEVILQLKTWNEAYRSGEPLVPDEVYDSKLKELKELNPNSSYLKSMEPGPVSDSRKEKLPVDMRSLDKVKSFEELQKWVNKIPLMAGESEKIVITPKYDGLSLLVEENSRKAWTRGGEDNMGQKSDSHFAMMGSDKFTYSFYTGGEAIISRLNWENHFEGKVNPKSGELYKTLRGTVAGLLNSPEAREELKYVDYMRYLIPGSELDYSSDILALNTCRKPIKFLVEDYRCLTESMLLSLYKQWSELYEIDGLVVSVDSKKVANAMGRDKITGNPKYSVAYKASFEERFKTKVVDVNVKVSKNGYLRPTVEIHPIYVDGAKIDNPSGNNAKFVFDNNIAAGSEITVIRSGSVIPKIVEFHSYIKNNVEALADRLTECPSCGGPTRWNSTMTDIMCTNNNCKGIALAKSVHFFNVMGFEEFGEASIEAIFNSYDMDCVQDFLTIQKYELRTIYGFGNSTIDNFLSQREKLLKEGCSLEKLMHASDCFDGIGETKAKLIIDSLSSQFKKEVFEDMVCGPSEDYVKSSLTSSKGIGDKTIKSFCDGISKFQQLISLWGIPIATEEKVETTNELSYLSICFSGIRNENLEETIKSKGGKIASGVSKTTTHLVLADPNSVSGKAVKARQLGVKILSMDEAVSLCGC